MDSRTLAIELRDRTLLLRAGSSVVVFSVVVLRDEGTSATATGAGICTSAVTASPMVCEKCVDGSGVARCWGDAARGRDACVLDGGRPVLGKREKPPDGVVPDIS